MTAIVCIEDRGGILFLKRRVSRDIEVLRDIVRDHKRIFLTEYSLPLFKDLKIDATVCELPLCSGEDGDVCFIEDGSIEYGAKISKILEGITITDPDEEDVTEEGEI